MSKISTYDKISIDSDSGIPLWLQLRNRLIYLITSGYYHNGDRLPTVRDLAVGLGINYHTVGKVYRDIERDGFITSRQGMGTFASDAYKQYNGTLLTEADLLIDEFIQHCSEIGIPDEDIVLLLNRRLEARASAGNGKDKRRR